MQLKLANITYTYPAAAEPVLRNVGATIPHGWTGLVGDNGSGKTTLALTACGILKPDAGIVLPELLACYCAQDASEPPNNLDEFAYAYDDIDVRLRSDIDIKEDWHQRYSTLSCGQQKRLQVACALWVEPDVLALDEPTNHLDATTRRNISKALMRFNGIGLLVSHGQDGKAGKLSSRMAGKLENVETRLASTRVEKRYDADVWFDAQ